jgi:hypothetical protein
MPGMAAITWSNCAACGSEWVGRKVSFSRGKKLNQPVMLNEPFRADARGGEVKQLLNGFCSVVSEKPDWAHGSLRRRLRRSFAHHDSYVIGLNHAIGLGDLPGL